MVHILVDRYSPFKYWGWTWRQIASSEDLRTQFVVWMGRERWWQWRIAGRCLTIISRPGRSQGLHYKHLCDWLIHPLVKIYLQRYHTQTVKNGASIHKKNYIDIFSDILNHEGHQNWYIGSIVTASLLNGWILPNGGASSGRVYACSLRSRLV